MKKIILTIDDGPSDYFGELLSYLIKKNHKAIFFCMGNKLEKPANREKVIEAIKKGFIIGNHSYSHPNFNLISFERGKEEILKTDELIDSLYKEANVKRVKFFRFPSFRAGLFNYARYQRLLKELGYSNPYHTRHFFPHVTHNERHPLYHNFQRIYRGKYDVYCTIDPSDWTTSTTVDNALRVLKKARSGDVIDLHDQPYSVKSLIEPICDFLSSRGFVLGI